MKNVCYVVLLTLFIFSCNRAKEKVDKVMTRTTREVQKVKDNIMAYTQPLPLKESFEKRTGLIISDTMFNIREADTYFPHEGEYSLVFYTSPKQINDWTSKELPWGKKWKDGPVPLDVLNCKFGLGDDSSKKIENWLSSGKNVKYVAEEFCCPDNSALRYHNGRVLILEIDKNQVWYSNWDY